MKWSIMWIVKKETDLPIRQREKQALKDGFLIFLIYNKTRIN